MPPTAWLRCSVEAFDRGEMWSARFPYAGYSPIETDADCLRAVRDQTERWDESFRPTLSADLCKLIALLNRSHRLTTTHTVIGSYDPKPTEYGWATSSFGVAITVIFRDTAARFRINDHADLVRRLCGTVSASHFVGDSTGWLLEVRPEVVNYEDAGMGVDIPGYGVEIRATAFATSESRCAERLSRLLAWITGLLSPAAGQ